MLAEKPFKHRSNLIDNQDVTFVTHEPRINRRLFGVVGAGFLALASVASLGRRIFLSPERVRRVRSALRIRRMLSHLGRDRERTRSQSAKEEAADPARVTPCPRISL
jgi:hypothetical protein